MLVVISGPMLGLVLACAGNGTGLDANGHPLGTSGECQDGVCFARDIQPIFSANCALSGCHAGTSPQQGQNLSEGLAYQSIVNVPANERAGMMRVRPSVPDSSYLVHKIQGTQASVGGSGGQMPLGGARLSQSQIDLIRAWIAAGARNN
jgi:mono/diheme cytochrome c family protein